MAIHEDLTGKKFGSRTVIRLSDKRIRNRPAWDAVCDCGAKSTAGTESIKQSKKCKMCAYKDPRPNRRLRPFEAQYNIFVNRARYPVTITYEQFLELTKIRNCHYCDAQIVWQEYRRKHQGGNGSNLDRKDNTRNYDIDNVVVCCGRCNYAKGSHFTYEEWRQLGELIRTWGTPRKYVVTPLSGRINYEKTL